MVSVALDQTGALTWSNPARPTAATSPVTEQAAPDPSARFPRFNVADSVVGVSAAPGTIPEVTEGDSQSHRDAAPAVSVPQADAVPPVLGSSTPQPSWQTTGQVGAVVTVPYGETTTVKVEGATAAYSLEAAVARATAHSGVVTVVGRAAGTTHVVVTTGSGVEFLRVRVGEPPVTTLPGFSASGVPSVQNGTLDLRYGSDIGLLQSTVRLMRREGSRTVEIGLSSAASIGRRQNRSFALPLVSYSISDLRRKVTFMDSQVANSPLTVRQSNLRGLHWQEGPWLVHAGYSFFGTFEHLLLAAEREQVAGVSYRHRLNRSSTVTSNLYYYRSPSASKADGVTGTVVIETKPFEGFEALGEVGVGGGTGAAAVDFRVLRPNFSILTTVRFAPDALPSLSTDQPSGRQIEAGLVKQAGDWRIDAAANSQRFSLGDTSQSSHVVRVSLTRLIARAIQLQAGSSFSVFDGGSSARSPVQSLGVPVSLSVAGGPIGAGIDYQWSREASRSGSGHLVRGNLSLSRHGFSLAFSAERQTQMPTAAAAVSEEPALQRELDRLGIAAGSPEQLAEVLRTNATLAALGYASTVNVDLTPTRDRLTGRIGWTGGGRFQPKFEISSMVNRDQGASRTTRSSLHAATASVRLRSGTEASLTWSLVCPNRPVLDRPCQPAWMTAIRQHIGRTAGLLSPGGGGDVRGVVFRDDERLGRHGKGMPTLQGYEVLLDGTQRTVTDATGTYRFRRVRAGRHTVEVRLPDDKSQSFTTPSPVEVDAGGSVDFGVAVARSRLRVLVTSDAEIPLGDVILQAMGGAKEYALTTGPDGVALFDALDAGTYDVRLEAASLPLGHFWPSTPERVTLSPTQPGLLTMVARAARSIAGRIRVFDRNTVSYVLAASVVVELSSTGARVVTDAQGRYVFRDLPPGDHTVAAVGGGRTITATVALPLGPATVTGVDLTLPAAGSSQPVR